MFPMNGLECNDRLCINHRLAFAMSRILQVVSPLHSTEKSPQSDELMELAARFKEEVPVDMATRPIVVMVDYPLTLI